MSSSHRPRPLELPSADWLGTKRYELVRCLGQGGMGVVYEARDRETGQTLALKTLRKATPNALYLFKREFRGLADVDHPNLVRLHEFAMSGSDRVFFTMELVRGTDFVSYVQGATSQGLSWRRDMSTRPTSSRKRPVLRGPSEHPSSRPPDADDWRAAVELNYKRPQRANLDRLRPALVQLVDGVMALHAARKLHRDIKPSNVLVTLEGRVVLLDFGVATDVSRVVDAEMREEDMLVGTATYMAPEQAFEEPTPACDWYSVGVMLYESMVGRPPFVGSVTEVLTMKATADPPPPSLQVEGIPADLDALCRALLQRGPTMRPQGSEILQQLGVTRASPERSASTWALRVTETAAAAGLIGREAHLRALGDAFDVACTQGMVTLRIGGRAGVGKSALVQWFVDDLVERHNAVVLRGRAYEREAMPYKAIDGIVDSLTRYLICLEDEELESVLPTDAWTIARLFPVLRRVPAIEAMDEEPIADPQRARRRAFRALRDLLGSLARRRPLVLFIDDVHWGDTDSAALLLELARPPDAPSLLLAMTYRDEQESTSAFLSELKAGWPQQAEVRDLAVGPLDPADARRLARTLLGSEDDSTEMVAQTIAGESGGNPFLIEELARNVVSQSPFPAHAPVTARQTTLEEMVSQRLKQLPDEARRCLELVAVSGRPVPMAVACVAAELQQTPEETLVLLRARRFVRSGIRDGREVVEVLHDRIRETIVNRLSSDTLREHHSRLARALETAPDPDVEALATHLLGAGDGDRAVRFAEQAAEQAATKLAFDQAAHLLRLAIAALPKSSSDGLRLRKRLGEFLEWAARNADAGRVYLEAVEVAPPAERLDLQRAAAEQLHASGRMDEGTRVLRAVLETVRVWAPQTPVTAFFWYLLHVLWLRIRGMRFRERDLSVDERRRLDALNAVAMGFALVDHILGVAMKARLLMVSMRMGDRLQTSRGAALVALDLAGYTGPESGIEHDLRTLARGLAQHPAAKATLIATHGILLHYRGHFRAAKEILDPLHLAVTNRRVAVHSAMLFALHSVQFLGNMAELTDRYKRALADAEERGNLFLSVALRTSTAASVWLAADEPERARRELREAMGQWGQKRFSSPEWRATVSETEVDLYLGEPASAYKQVKNLSRALFRNCFFVVHTRVLVAFAQGRSAIASLDGLPPSDRKRRLKEAQHWTRVLLRKRMTWTAPLASILEAGVALARGDRTKAESALHATAEGAKAAEMTLHGAAARHELGLLMGGDEGAAVVRAASDAMISLGIRVPARFAPMLVPGLRK